MGSQLEKRAQDRINKRKPRASTNESRMMAVVMQNILAFSATIRSVSFFFSSLCKIHSLLSPAAMMAEDAAQRRVLYRAGAKRVWVDVVEKMERREVW